MSTWHEGLLAGFDLETTGVDPETARVVTGSVVVSEPGGVSPCTWLVNPGVPIPDGAVALHGVTTERAQQEGLPAAEAVRQIVESLCAQAALGTPLVAMNARYDMTVLDREARRHGVVPLTDRAGAGLRVLDPIVLDKQVDRYRRGKRTLSALCEHYRVPLTDAHSADADAVAAVGVVRQIARRWPAVSGASVDFLHEAQVGWARQQAESLAAYYRRLGSPERAQAVSVDWPLVPARQGGGAAGA